MISVSRRVGSFQISRNRPSRTPSKTRATALFDVRIDHDVFHAPSTPLRLGGGTSVGACR
jgi:hypothetical protein